MDRNDLPPTRQPGKVSDATIQRLPVYLYRLQALQKQGVRRVSSRDLADQVRVKAAQLRHDFRQFGGFSRPGQPYDVDHTVRRLREILGLAVPVDCVLAGLGNLGQAIASYSQFGRDGFNLVGLFDINPKLVGYSIRGIAIEDIDAMPAFINQHGVQLGIIAVPPEAAQSVADMMAGAGIRGIWNFAPVELRVPSPVVLHDEFLSVGIMSLRYKVKAMLENGGGF